MTALRKSTAARLTKRIFGKVRRFLKRAKIAMKDPLPIVETRDKHASREVMRSFMFHGALPNGGDGFCKLKFIKT